MLVCSLILPQDTPIPAASKSTQRRFKILRDCPGPFERHITLQQEFVAGDKSATVNFSNEYGWQRKEKGHGIGIVVEMNGIFGCIGGVDIQERSG
jgi:hypothetical protein